MSYDQYKHSKSISQSGLAAITGVSRQYIRQCLDKDILSTRVINGRKYVISDIKLYHFLKMRDIEIPDELEKRINANVL